MQTPHTTRRGLATLLCASLVWLSVAPAAPALAAERAVKPGVAPALRLPAPAIAVPAAPKVSAVSISPAESASAMPFARSLTALQAPSAIEAAAERGGGTDVSRGAAADDFDARLGLKNHEAAAEPEPSYPQTSRSGQSVENSPRSGGPALARPAAARRRAATTVPAGAQRWSAYFPLASVATAALLSAVLFAASLLLPASANMVQDGPTVAGVAHAVVTLLSWGGLAATATTAVWAARNVVRFARAMASAEPVTDEQFDRFLRAQSASGDLNAGLVPLIRPYRPDPRRRGWLPDLTLGYASGGFIYVRPELIASPKLFGDIVVHEHSHVEALNARGPPPSGFWRGAVHYIRSEAAAYAAESAATIRDLRVSLVERALRRTASSLRYDKPIDVLLLNVGADLADPSVYRAVSGSQARPKPVKTDSPLEALQAEGRYQAVVMEKVSDMLPIEGAQARQLEVALRQLEALHVLAVRRMRLADAGFAPGSSEARKYSELADKIERASGSAQRQIQEKIQDMWREVASTRLKGSQVPAVIEGLYARLEDKGLAMLAFRPGDPGVAVWERLLRYWQAGDGGEFEARREDYEDGSHMLVLRKLESRVGMWISPPAGRSIARSVPNATATPKSREAARNAAVAAGLGAHLETFDKLGVQITQVFGGNAQRHEIYVTVPRRNAAALRGVVMAKGGRSVRGGPSNYRPLMMDSPRLHHAPPALRIVSGKGYEVGLTDTGLDQLAADVGPEAEQIDMTGTGLIDTSGHGTLNEAIIASRGKAYPGLAPAVKAIMVKVFGNEPGASDGTIMGALELLHQRGVHVIEASLGIKSHSGAPLSEFASAMSKRKNGKGFFSLFVGSGGNSGPFDRSLSSPGNAKEGFTIGAAAKSLDDGIPEIPFYSSVGPDYDSGFAIEWLFLKTDMTWVGGDVVTDPGDSNVFKRGVFAAKSRDMPPALSDTPDRQHTGMSGTSMAAPMGAAAAVDVLEALDKTGLSKLIAPQDIPLALKAILMLNADDMQVPVWFQGAGFGNLEAAVDYVMRTAKTIDKQAALDWIRRYGAVRELDHGVRDALALTREQANARFDDGVSEDSETPPEGRIDQGNAVAAEVMKKFGEEKAKALPSVLAALKDPVWLIRRQAAMTLLNFKAPEAAMDLAETAIHDPDARVRQMAFLALAETRAPIVDLMLRGATADSRWDVSLYASYALARHGDVSAVAGLAAAMGTSDKRERFTATWLLGQLARKAEAAEARTLAAKVAQADERQNIRHLAAAALFNIAQAAPRLLADASVLRDLLGSAGSDNLALTRTIAKIFPVAVANRDFLERLKQDDLKGIAAEFVARNRAAASAGGALGELVRLLAGKLGLPLDLPTAVPDPAGRGVAGVDPLLGPLDVLIELPSGSAPKFYWDESRGPGEDVVAAAGLDAAELEALSARPRAALPLSRSLWISVPEHKLYAFAVAMERRGYAVHLPSARYSAARRADATAGDGLVLDVSREALPRLPDAGASLIRVRAGDGASEARVAAALEAVYAAAKPASVATVVSLDSVGPALRPGADGKPAPWSLTGLLASSLMLGNLLVVAPAGNEGPGEQTLAVEPGSALIVGAAERPSELAWYSARGRGGEAPIAFTQLVDPLSDEAGSHGTGEAAERAAGKLAGLGRRAAKAFALSGRPLPDGLMLLVADVVERSLAPIPGRGPQDVGGGLFGDDFSVLTAALDRRLADLDEAAKDAAALIEKARRRHADSLAAAGPLDVLARSAAAALQQVLAVTGPVEDAAQRWVESLLFERRTPWVQPISVRYARGPRKTVDLAPAW